jgi:tocopherol O-methyltransferase
MATSSQIREHYDSLSFIYQAFWGDHIHHGLFEDHETPAVAQVKMLDYCSRLLDLKGCERVFDVGCGHGGTLLYLAQRFGCSGTGLTLSPKQAHIAIDHARKAKLADQIGFVVGDADSFSFPVSAADVAWAMESSEHFASKARFLQNAYELLRPSGKLLLAAWTGSMQSTRVREVARVFLCPELWTAEQYEFAAKSAGFKILRGEDLTAKVVRTWEICRERALLARAAVLLLPRAAREFAQGIDIILDAYGSGDLTYTVLEASKGP